MRILVIGATGFLGPHVVKQLVETGQEVAAFHRGQTEANLPDSVHLIHGDRNYLPQYQNEFEAFSPDIVLDMIPYTETQARQLVTVFRGLADRVVVLSSGDVYRNYDGWRGESNHYPDAAPLREDSPLRDKLYPYRGYDGLGFAYAEDYEKIDVESVVKGVSGLPRTVLRLPALYGPGDTQHRFASFLKRMADDRPFILLGEQQASWRWTRGYVENVAAAIAQAVTDPRASGAVYNVGERETPTEADRVRELARAVGWQGRVITLPEKDLPNHLQTPFDWRYELAIDTSRIRAQLGYVDPVDRIETLRRTVEWEWPQLSDVIAREALDYKAEDTAVAKSIAMYDRPDH